MKKKPEWVLRFNAWMDRQQRRYEVWYSVKLARHAVIAWRAGEREKAINLYERGCAVNVDFVDGTDRFARQVGFDSHDSCVLYTIRGEMYARAMRRGQFDLEMSPQTLSGKPHFPQSRWFIGLLAADAQEQSDEDLMHFYPGLQPEWISEARRWAREYPHLCVR